MNNKKIVSLASIVALSGGFWFTPVAANAADGNEYSATYFSNLSAYSCDEDGTVVTWKTVDGSSPIKGYKLDLTSLYDDSVKLSFNIPGDRTSFGLDANGVDPGGYSAVITNLDNGSSDVQEVGSLMRECGNGQTIYVENGNSETPFEEVDVVFSGQFGLTGSVREGRYVYSWKTSERPVKGWGVTYLQSGDVDTYYTKVIPGSSSSVVADEADEGYFHHFILTNLDTGVAQSSLSMPYNNGIYDYGLVVEPDSSGTAVASWEGVSPEGWKVDVVDSKTGSLVSSDIVNNTSTTVTDLEVTKKYSMRLTNLTATASESVNFVIPDVPADITLENTDYVTKPTIVDEIGWKNDSVTAPKNSDKVTYNIVSYDQKTGEWVMTVTASNGYVFNDGSTVKTFNGKLDVTEGDPELIVIPISEIAAPTIVDKPGWKNDSVTAPKNTDKINYRLHYSQNVGEWNMTATPNEGYVFEGGETSYTQSGKLDVNDVVDPVNEPKVIRYSEIISYPVIVDKPGWKNDSATAPKSTDKITYEIVSYDQQTGKWVMTATANDGYVFEGTGSNQITSTGWLDIDPFITNDIKPPTIVDKPGYKNDSVTAPEDNIKISYKLDYDQKSGKWTLTATTNEGYVFGDGSTINVQSGILNVIEDAVNIPTPVPQSKVVDYVTKPVIVDKPGYKNDSVTAPKDSEGVKYSVDYNQTTGEWVMTVTANDGYVFNDGSTVKTFNGVVDIKPGVVKVEAPVIVDEIGYKNDSVTAPKDTAYVKYKLDYNQQTGKWALTATTVDGYVFNDGETVSVQYGVLNVVEALIPEVVETGVVSNSDSAYIAGLWATLTALLGAVGGYLVGSRKKHRSE